MRAWLWVWLTWSIPTSAERKAKRFDAMLARAYRRAHHHERYRPW